MATAPAKDEIQQRHLGLPPRLLSTSLLTWEGIAEVTAALRLAPGGALLDLACGRGGYGLEVAGRGGVALTGVDFSAEAIRQASEQARLLGRPAEFRVGTMAATGLPDGGVTAVMCIDAIQFADPPRDAYRELRRVLTPGGRAALTSWEAVDRADDRLSARLRGTDLRAGLSGAGFREVQVASRPGWRERERVMWTEAAALDPAGDAALESFRNEGIRSIATFSSLRRILATATAP